MFAIGNTIRFDYPSKSGGLATRMCHIERVKKGCSPFLGVVTTLITGWDATADRPTGGYRSFDPYKMTNVEVLA